MIINSNIKHNAKLRMRGKWPSALCILGLTVGVSMASSFFQAVCYTLADIPLTGLDLEAIADLSFDEIIPKISVVLFTFAALTALQLFVITPLSLGEYSFYWKNASAEEPQASTVLTWFAKGRYMRSVCTGLLVNLLEALWGMLCLLPAVFMFSAMYSLSETGYQDSLTVLALFAAGVLCTCVGLYTFLRVIQRYFLVPYLLTAYDHLNTGSVLALSKEMMRDYGRDALNFELSFVGWYLLCIFVLPVMYVSPYINQVFAEYAKAIIDAENKKRDEARLRHEEMMKSLYPASSAADPFGYSIPAAEEQ